MGGGAGKVCYLDTEGTVSQPRATLGIELIWLSFPVPPGQAQDDCRQVRRRAGYRARVRWLPVRASAFFLR